MVAERLGAALGLCEDGGSSEVWEIQLSVLAPRLGQREQQVRARCREHSRLTCWVVLKGWEPLSPRLFCCINCVPGAQPVGGLCLRVGQPTHVCGENPPNQAVRPRLSLAPKLKVLTFWPCSAVERPDCRLRAGTRLVSSPGFGSRVPRPRRLRSCLSELAVGCAHQTVPSSCPSPLARGPQHRPSRRLWISC